MLAQQQLRLRNLVLTKSERRVHQPRIFRRGLYVLRIGGVCTLEVSFDRQLVAQGPPSVRHVRFERDGPAKRSDGRPACIEQRESELVVRGCPVGLRARQRLENLQCGIRLCGDAAGAAQQQCGDGMAGRGSQDFAGLLGGQLRVALHQPRRMSERNVDSADWLCFGAQIRLSARPALGPYETAYGGVVKWTTCATEG